MAIHYWDHELIEVPKSSSVQLPERMSAQTDGLESGRNAARTPVREGVPFAPIGLGKPLSIRIHTAYVGDLRTWWNRRTDLLLVSGIKAPQTFDAVGRAINVVQPRMKDHEYVEFSAFDEGSSLVYYTRSITDFDLNASFELVPDSFDERSLSKLANLFQTAGGLPVFAPAATYLLAGSVVTNMIGDLGKAFIESAPILRDTLKLNFGVAGLPLFEAGFYLVTNDGTMKDPARYVIGHKQYGQETVVRLLNRDTQEPYEGDIPYLILGVDGHEEPNLEHYEPHLAAASVLEKFYPSSDGMGVMMDQLGKAATLFNDLKSREDAQRIKERLDGLKKDSPEYPRLKALYDAHRRNIQQKEFQIPEDKDTE